MLLWSWLFTNENFYNSAVLFTNLRLFQFAHDLVHIFTLVHRSQVPRSDGFHPKETTPQLIPEIQLYQMLDPLVECERFISRTRDVTETLVTDVDASHCDQIQSRTRRWNCRSISVEVYIPQTSTPSRTPDVQLTLQQIR